MDVWTKAAALLQSELNGLRAVGASNDDVYDLVMEAAGHDAVEEIGGGYVPLSVAAHRFDRGDALGVLPRGWSQSAYLTDTSLGRGDDKCFREELVAAAW